MTTKTVTSPLMGGLIINPACLFVKNILVMNSGGIDFCHSGMEFAPDCLSKQPEI